MTQHKAPLKLFSQWEKELAEIIGEEALIKLEERFGRSYLYIPVTPKPEIVDAIGMEATQKLIAVYGSFDIYVPRALLKKRRNAEIVQRINAGRSLTELAAEFRLSEKWLRQIKQESEQNGDKRSGGSS